MFAHSLVQHIFQSSWGPGTGVRALQENRQSPTLRTLTMQWRRQESHNYVSKCLEQQRRGIRAHTGSGGGGVAGV